MNESEKNQIKKMLATFPEIKLAYFFGSKKLGVAGPMSDFDFGIYLDHTDKKRTVEIQLSVIAGLSQILKTDNIDLVIMNTAFPGINYQIITTGELLCARAPYQVAVEPEILNQYFDHQITLKQFNLTKSK